MVIFGVRSPEALRSKARVREGTSRRVRSGLVVPSWPDVAEAGGVGGGVGCPSSELSCASTWPQRRAVGEARERELLPKRFGTIYCI